MKTNIGPRRLPFLGTLAFLLSVAVVLALFAPVTADAQDTTAPTLQSATVDGSTVTLTFNEALQTTSIPSASRFTVSRTSVTTVAFKSGDAASVELTISPGADATTTDLDVSYTRGNDANPLQDASGNQVRNFSSQPVTNVNDTTAPTVVIAVVDGSLLVLGFNESFNTSKVPAASRFSVSGTESATTVTNVRFYNSTFNTVVAKRLELTLSRAVTKGNKGITLSYTKGNDANPLQDAAGNELANLSSQAVGNATGAPTLETATVNGSTLTLTFSEPMYTAHGPPSQASFTVSGTSSATSVTNAVFKSDDPTSVELTLSPAVAAGDTGITVSYASGNDESPLRETSYIINLDAGGAPTIRHVPEFSGQKVTNETGAEQPTDTPDTTAPAVQSAGVNGATLTLTFDEALKTTSAPGTSRFAVSGTDSATSVTAVAFKNGDTASVELTLTPAVAEGDTGIRVSYAQGADANPLQDAAGNKVADFSGQAVRNNAPDATAPMVPSATVDGSSLYLTFNENLNTSKVPSASRFTVAGTASTTSVTAVAFIGGDAASVKLTLSPAVAGTDTGITVSYAQGNDANPLQDRSGNKVADFSGQQVANNTSSSNVGILIYGYPPVTEGTAARFLVAAVDGLGNVPPALSSPLTVNLLVSEPPGSDFVAAGDEGVKTVVIAAGQVRANYTVNTVDDSTDEPHGSVKVRVRSGAGYWVEPSNTDSVRVDDNDTQVSDPTAPKVRTAWVDGSFLALNFNKALKATSLPSASRFTVAGTASTTSVTAVRFDAFTTKRVLLSVSPAVAKGDTGITVSYAQGNDAKPLQDAAGRKVADFSGQDAVNTTGVPTVQSATVNGSTLTLTFTEPLYTANGPPSSGTFSVAGTASATSVTAVAFKTGDAASVELTLSPAVAAGDTGITVSYAVGNEVYTLQETITSLVSTPPHLGGIPDEVADFSGQQVTNVTGTDTPDTTAPTVTRATVDGSTLALDFSETMDTTKVPGASRFTVAGTNSATTVTAVRFINSARNIATVKRVELTLSPAVAKGDTGITVSYTQANDANPLQDAAGNKLANFTGQTAVNATGVPTVQSAAVNGATLTLTFTEPLYTENGPPSSGVFTVAGTDIPTSVTAVAFKSGDATSLELTLSPAVSGGDTGITLTYAQGSELYPLQETDHIMTLVEDHGGSGVKLPFINLVADFSGQQVTNVASDTRSPTVQSATVDGATLTLTLDEALKTTGVPSASRFTVIGIDGAISVTAVAFKSGDAASVELTLRPAVSVGATGIFLDYAKGDDANPLQDASGNKVADFSAQAVENVNAVPTVQTATVRGSTLTLTFNAPLYTSGGVPSTARFSVAGTGSATSVTAVAFKSGDAASVELTLSPAVADADSGITVSYTRGSDPNQLLDRHGNFVADFTGQQVTNVTGDPVPGAPAAPSASAVPLQPDRLSVSWSAPGGVAATDYDLRYYQGSADPANEADWIEPGEAGGHDHRGRLATATITGLLPVTTYRVQVRAVNNGDAGPWSASGSGRTEGLVGAQGTSVLELTGNTLKTVGGNTSLAANDVAQGFTAAGHDLGYTVTDVDLRFSSAPDAGVQVRLATGVSGSSAGTTVATLRNPAALAAGVVTFTAPPRTTLAANGTYFVVVEGAAGNLSWTNSNAEDGLLDFLVSNSGFTRAASSTGAWTGRGQKASVRVNGRENVGDPPGAPAAPTLTAVTGSTGVEASWSAPAHTGSGITDYDVRYYQGSADPANEADWVEEDESTGLPYRYTADASTSATITGLQPSTAYRVQVRAESHGAPGPWSDSSPVTTNAATGTNNAPTLAKLAAVAANGCVADTAGFRGTYTITAGVLQSVRGIIDTSNCVSEPRVTPIFIDPDGDDLTVIVTTQVPDNVRLLDGTPFMDGARDRVWIRAVAAGSATNIRVDLTAIDPHGEEVSAWFDAKVGLNPNNATPRFDEMVGLRGFPVGAPVGRWVLPPANGGNVPSQNSAGQLPYFYAVSGLPPGLSFDPMTRAVTGTPTQAGSYTVTYTADDADAAYSLKASPTAADLADVARQSFVVRIGAPAIELVQIVSAPTYDADGDGSFDTYIQGDEILVDVQFTEAVEVTGTPERAGTRPRMRLDLGPDDETDNRVTADLLEEGGSLYGGRRLRFGYTVQSTDTDPDGVWVQTAGANGTVVFVPAGLSVTSVESGAAVVRTFSGLPTAGAANAKVDGSVTSASIGPRPLSAVTDAAGDTVTVTFNRALNTQVDLSGTPLAAYFAVRGAGVVGAGARGHYQHPNTVAVSGSTAVLELNTPANASDTVTLSYENVGGAVWPLKDQSSPPKRVAGWIDLAVTNNSTGVAAPVPTSASAVGTALELVFDQRLDQDSRPPGSAFTVRAENVDRVRRTIAGVDTAVVIDDAKVAVTLAAGVVEGELLSVSYARPAESPLRNAASTAAVASFEAFKVEGVYDSTAPTLLSKLANIQLTPANDDASQGKSSIMLYYDERLDRTSVPAVGDFALSSTDSGAVAGAVVSSVAVEDTAVVVTTSHWLRDNIDYTLAYTPGTAPIEDLAGNAAAAFTETVRSFAVGQPVLRGSTVAGTRLELNMASPLNPGAVPPPSAFTLWETDVVAGETELHPITGTRIVSVAVNASLAVLQLNHPVYPCAGETVFRVSYTLPASGDERFQTAAGWGADGWTATKWRGQANDHALVTNARHGRCADWLAGTYIGSVVLQGERAFARDRGEPKAEWFTVTASGGPVAVTGAAFDPDDPKVLKLSLSREFAAGETVTVSYRRPAGVSGLWDVNGNQLRDVVEAPVRSGAPVLSVSDARAVEGEAVEFTVSLSAASDEEVTVDYATSDGTAASGTDFTAASGTLTFAAGATSRTVRVETAGDSADEDEETFALTLSNPSGATLSNASATGTIEDEAAALTASFHGLPDAHDGRRLFGFELRFSEEFRGLRLTALEAGALAVTGGRLVDVKRTVRGENRRVTVRVRPAGAGDMTLTLRAPADCAAADAICASDGRKLSAAVSAAVQGPAVLSVADARADEGATLAFAVTLSKAADAPVTVDYATVDGTANAGADYTAASGTLTFAAGETAKTVAVALLHDTAAEADETVGLRLSNASGATIGDGAATGTVVNVAPLTASLHGLPEEHDGKKLFGFEVRFSEEFRGLRLTAFKAGALQVTNGRVIDAKRMVRGENRSVTVRVRPSSFDDLTLTLLATTDCSAASAICTHDGRKLANTVTATVRGPVTVSVADAEAQEGVDAAIAFAVTLNRAASGEVTVDYATRDGTATAGEDYTFTRGTLTFAVGDTEKSVEVPVLDDALDEGNETFTLKLTGAQGAVIDDGEATGTIKNSDPLQKMWLSRFGRTVADHVTAAVADRLANPLSGGQVTVGGQTVNLAEVGDDAFLGRTLTSIAQVMGAPSGPAPADDFGSGAAGTGPGHAGAGPWPGTGLGLGDNPTATSAPGRLMTGRELLLGSAFHLAREGDGGGPGLAAWGRVTVGGFDGEAPGDTGTVRIDGQVTTGILGTDAEWDRLLAGVAVSVSEGEGTFDQPGVDSGTIESTMTTVSPYARVTLSDRVSVWGLAGYGTGDMTIVQAANDRGQPERINRTDLSMRLAALGGRGALLTPEAAGGLDLALRADGFFVQTTSEAVSNEGDTSADASRVRLILEGRRAFQVGGGTFTPGLEVGLRHDGGDAETGTGVELGGRASFTDPDTGLSVEASVRALIAHEDSDYREWGASGAVRLAPGERGRGLSFSLAPTWGAPGSGVDRLWSAQDARGLAPTGGEFEPESRLEGELGYGMALFGDRFTGTPNVGFGLSGAGARDYRIGWRLTSVIRGDPGFEVALDATRREPANDNGAGTPEHGVMLRAGIRW